jgi:hypothetical protein
MSLVAPKHTSLYLDAPRALSIFHLARKSYVRIVEVNRGAVKFLDLPRSSSIYVAGILTGGKERKSFTMKFEYQSNICSDRNSCERRASPLGINVDGMVRRNKVRNSAGK